MATCPEIMNTTIVGTRETWTSVDRTTLKDFTTSSYFRPDTGAALLPWVYTLVAIIIHLPVLLVRIVHLDLVRDWLYFSTSLVILVYIQGYISTRLAADQVLVWTPVVLVIDAGSMLQIIFLVLEKEALQNGRDFFVFRWCVGAWLKERLRQKHGGNEAREGQARNASDNTELGQVSTSHPEAASLLGQQNLPPTANQSGVASSSLQTGNRQEATNQQRTANPGEMSDSTEQNHSDQNDQTTPLIRSSPSRSITPSRNEESHTTDTAAGINGNQGPSPGIGPDPARGGSRRLNILSLIKRRKSPKWTVIIAFIFWAMVMALQIAGLQAAIRALGKQERPLVSWCSPLFQPFGIAVMDGSCHVYKIDQSTTRGIGCVQIPGVWQQRWLIGTIVGIFVGWVCQFVDFILPYFVEVEEDWWIFPKAERPLTTMIAGLLVLVVTLLYGVEYARNLPPGMTDRVTVAIDVNGTKAFNANLTNSGLRGTVIGWNDGLFQSWGSTYTGKTGL